MNAPVVLITGAARRIGAAIARRFHLAGYNIALHYHHSEAAAARLLEELNNARQHSATLYRADLADIASVREMAVSVQERCSRVDVLINNASSFYPTPIADADENDWDNLIGSNLKGPYFLCQALATTLREHRGCVINIADVHGAQPLKQHSIYCIAKAGNLMLTKSLAKDLAPDVRVNGIAPGAILWPENLHYASDAPPLETLQQQVVAKIPLERIGSPQDIAETALFLAQSASYCTGSIIKVDGGRSLTS